MNQTKTKKHNNGGITLIALVITIIVLLILAGITINLTIGQNGIMNMAEKAGQNYLNAQIAEQDNINSLSSQIDIASSRDETEKINDIIEQKLKWKKLGDAIGTQELSLPSSFYEIYIEIGNCNNIIIPYNTLTTSKKIFYYGTPEDQTALRAERLIAIEISQTTVNLRWDHLLESSGVLRQDITATTQINVYYR